MVQRRQVLALLAGAAALCGLGPLVVARAADSPTVPAAAGSAAAAPAARSAGVWGRAIEVPGLAGAQTQVVSCGAPGNCTAGGTYLSHGRNQGFVVSERGGHWLRATAVPGLAALNKGAVPGIGAYVAVLSCTAAGNCAAGGSYLDQRKHAQAFVVSERSGRWGKAIEIPGLAALEHGRQGVVNSLSCTSAGNCGAGGWYDDSHGRMQGFVVTERNGRWNAAIEVPGLGALNTDTMAGEGAQTLSVSCASAGNCAAGGYYSTKSFQWQGFVVTERAGHWGRAIEVPGLGALNTSGGAQVQSLSCASAGNCSAGGFYASGGHQQGFVVAEKNGHWNPATEVPGLAALNTSGQAFVNSVSCAAAGNCTAGGIYDGAPNFPDNYGKGYVVTEHNGVWGRAVAVAGLAALHATRYSGVASVSCASAGNCAAGGWYMDNHGYRQGFVAVQRNGGWGLATEVPGLAVLNKGGSANVAAVSCATPASCVAGGSFMDSHGHYQGYLT